MQKLNGKNSLLDNPHFNASAACKNLQNAMLGFIDVGARGGVHDYVLPVAGHTSVLGFESVSGCVIAKTPRYGANLMCCLMR